MRNRSRTFSGKSASGHRIFLIIVLAVAIFAISWKLILPQIELKRYPIAFSAEVSRAAKEFDLPEELIYAVILTESSFNPEAISHANAKGLMQLTDDTNEWTAMILREEPESERIFEPEMNIRRGCCLLSYLLEEFGSVETALAAYNAGIGRVRNWLKMEEYSKNGVTLDEIPIAETRNYVKKVTSARDKYKELYFSE